MTKELDTINELVGDALAGVRLTLTALRSIQAAVIEGNTIPAAGDTTYALAGDPGLYPRTATEFADTPRTRKPRSDKGKPRGKRVGKRAAPVKRTRKAKP